MLEGSAPVKDLDSSPWKSRPVLVQSAYKRCRKRVWKWKRIVNGTPAVKREWVRRGWELPKLTDREVREEGAFKEKQKKPGKRKRGGDEDGSEED
jgi:hypothetical protein